MRLLTIPILILILILSLALPTDAAARRRKPRKGKSRAVRVVAIRTCPPPVIRYVQPDSVTVISQDEEAALQAAIAHWMRSQPEMSPEAATKARRTAEKFYWMGREVGRQE